MNQLIAREILISQFYSIGLLNSIHQVLKYEYQIKNHNHQHNGEPYKSLVFHVEADPGFFEEGSEYSGEPQRVWGAQKRH